MSFGWSAGDISMAISLVMKIYKALDDTFGASIEYRDTVSFLRGLKYTLDKLLQFIENDEVENAVIIREHVDMMMPKVTEFLNLIEKKYGQSLEKDSPKRFKTIAGKLEWAAVTSSRARELRDRILGNMQTIDRLIQFDIHTSVQTKIPHQIKVGFSDIEAHLKSTIEPLKTDYTQTLQIIQTHYPSITNALRTLQASIQSISRASSPLLPAYSSSTSPQLKLDNKQCSMVATRIKRSQALTFTNYSTGFENYSAPKDVIYIADTTLDRLRTWLRSTTSETIWIQETDRKKNSLPMTAALFLAGELSKTPVIGYSMAKGQRPWMNEKEMSRQTLANIISSLISQFVEIIPSLALSMTRKQQEVNISIARFSVLRQQNLKSISASIVLLRDLINLTTTPFVVVLDCFRKFDLVKDKIVRDTVQQLVSTLSKGREVKLLLSSTEQDRLLNSQVTPSKRIIITTSKQDPSYLATSRILVELLNSASEAENIRL